MALGTLLGTLGTAALTAGVSTGASMLASRALGGGGSSGGRSGAGGFRVPGFEAGGLRGRFAGDSFNVGSSAGRRKLVGGLSRTFPQQANELAKLRARVAPGVSDLRRVRLEEVESARTAAIGNLRENLQRRRVLGSSFGQDAVTRAEAEFAQQKERVAAESFLQELELTHGLLGEEFEARRGAFQTKLGELNLQADIAAKLVGQATEQLGAASRLEMQLASQEAAGRGKFFGDTFKPVFDEVGKGISSMFSPAPATTTGWGATVVPA